jgi:hypothetical protein
MYIINPSNCHEGNTMEDSEFILVPFPSSASSETKEEKESKDEVHVIDNQTAAADDDVTDGSKGSTSWKESVKVFFPMIVCWVLAHFVFRRRS